MKLNGALTALVTPFQDDGSLDIPALRRLVDWQIDSGIAGLVACGTTGETPTLSQPEQDQVIETILEVAAGRVPVIAGAGGNDTRAVVERARIVAGLGVDGLLSVSPYYNRPSQEGLLAHFRAVADATALPVVLYNVPGRTGGNIDPATAVALAEHPNVVALKEASGRIASFEQVLARAPESFAVLSGDDALTLPALSLGASGVISVVSNLEPARMQALVEAGLRGDFGAARRIHYALSPLMRACFLDTNPVPVKAGLAHRGRCALRYRLPLVPSSAAVHAEMVRCLDALEEFPAAAMASASTPEVEVPVG